jgi:hypothetical protein
MGEGRLECIALRSEVDQQAAHASGRVVRYKAVRPIKQCSLTSIQRPDAMSED